MRAIIGRLHPLVRRRLEISINLRPALLAFLHTYDRVKYVLRPCFLNSNW